jgi:hypothetical protein
VRIRRLLGAALAMPVMLGGLLLVTAGPAAACSYPAPASEAQYAARAEVVFEGTLVARVDRIDRAARAARDELARKLGGLSQTIAQMEAGRPREQAPKQRRVETTGQLERLRADRAVVGRKLSKLMRSSDRAVLTFEVSRVYKGAAGQRQEIVTSLGPCAQPLSGAGPFLVFANEPSPDTSRQYQLNPGQLVFSMGSRALADGGKPALGEAGGPDSWPAASQLAVGVGILAAGVATGLGLATLRARRRAGGD